MVVSPVVCLMHRCCLFFMLDQLYHNDCNFCSDTPRRVDLRYLIEQYRPFSCTINTCETYDIQSRSQAIV